MNSNHVDKKLIFYLEGELSKAETLQLEAHLAVCPECMLKFNYLQNALGIIVDEKVNEVKPFLYTRIQGKLQAPASSKFKWAIAPAMLVSVLVVGLFLGTLFGNITSERNASVPEYELAYLFNDAQLENIEYKLLKD